MALHRTSCCGCRSIPDLSIYKTPEDVLNDILPDLMAIKGAFIVFTSTTNRKLGRRLVNFIHENKYGVVTETDYTSDGKGSNVRAFMWAFDLPALKKFYTASHPPIEVGMKVRVKEEWLQENGVGFGHPEGIVYGVTGDNSRFNFRDSAGWSWSAYPHQVQIL